MKIEGVEFTDDVANEPHVGCNFQVKFFDFDGPEYANITFTGQAPSSNDKVVLLSEKNKQISDDAAGGAEPDHDAVLNYPSKDLNLGTLKEHAKQGFHIKITVEIIGEPGAGKHKVFWSQDCREEEKNGSSSAPTTSTPPGGGGGSLPVTGAAVGGLALAGAGLLAGGATLLIMHRRRKATVFTP